MLSKHAVLFCVTCIFSLENKCVLFGHKQDLIHIDVVFSRYVLNEQRRIEWAQLDKL